MYAVGRVGSYISQGFYTVSAPFHPFGGAVDIIIVEQPDGSFRSSPWYVRFGKFQGVLKTREKVVSISVNGVEADFHMYLDHKGEAFFLREVDGEEEGGSVQYHPSSSGEETNRLSGEPNLVGDIDLSNGKIVARKGSRRTRIFGFAFGRKQVKGKSFQEGDCGSSVDRASSLERAEIAAVLLEVKWYTNLATNRPKKDNRSCCSPVIVSDAKADKNFLINGDITQANSPADETGRLVAKDNCEEESCYDFLNGAKILQIEVSSVKFSSSTCSSSITEPPLSLVDTDHMTSNDSETKPVEIYHQDMEINQLPRVVAHGQTQLGSDEAVFDLVKKVESRSPCTTNASNTANPTEDDEIDNYKDDISSARHPQEVKCEPTAATIILQSQCSEEEHYIFNDNGDFKFNEIQCIGSESSDHVENGNCPSPSLMDTESARDHFDTDFEPYSSSEKFISEILPNDFEYLVEKSRQASSPNDTFGHLKEGEDEQFVESLPSIWSHTDNQDEKGLHLPSRLFDSNMKSTNWALAKNNLASCMESAAEKENQGANGQYRDDGFQVLEELDTALGSLSVENSNAVDEDKTGFRPKVVKKIRAITPTTDQLASLNLKEGKNIVIFTFSTAMLGKQQVDAKIYLWKWHSRVVISDVDGTITKSDVLGQFMPLIGVDWSQIGVAHLFSAIKENGYETLYLSARSISQACQTRQFLVNLKQGGKALPDGPVIISPDGLFPCLFREVIRRAPQEFKIACLKDIKGLFPSDCNPFYAGFGNRHTDEFSYLKVGIPRGKIFIVNSRGEVAVNRRIDTRSYTSLQHLVHGMFPAMSSSEQEDYNSWNYWKLPRSASDA